MFDQIISYLINIPFEYNLIVTVVINSFDNQIKEKIQGFKPDAKIIIADGSGMDIKPFLIAYKEVHSECKYVLKVHTKKSIAMGANMGANWFKSMMEHTLSNPELVHAILNNLKDTDVGMIGGNLIYNESENIYPNDSKIEELKEIIGVSDTKKYKWIAGSIFWCKRDILDLLNDKIDYIIKSMPDKYETDGTYAHALERVFGAMVYHKENIVRRLPITMQNSKKRVLFLSHEESSSIASKTFKEIIDATIRTNIFDCCVVSLKRIDDKWNFPNSFMLSELKGDSDEEKINYLKGVINPDLVFANSLETYGQVKYFTCKKTMYIHEFKSLNFNIDSLKTLDKIFVANQSTKEILTSNNIESEVVQYYLNFNLPYTEWIVAIGDACYKQGVDRFISLAESMPNEKFLWIGKYDDISSGYITVDGWNYKTIKIPNNVTFIGNQSEEVVVSTWFPKSKVIVCLSYDNPFSFPIMQAKVNNKIVVVLKESGDSYIICDKEDLILDKYDEKKISEFIQRLTCVPPKNAELVNLLKSNYNVFFSEVKKQIELL